MLLTRQQHDNLTPSRQGDMFKFLPSREPG